MKEFSRTASFWILTIVYILAAAVGVAVYLRLAYNWWLKLLIADVAATVVTFIFSLLFKNASVYDPYWSVQPIVIVLALAVGQEPTILRVLLMAAVCLWGLRLTANWAYTFHGLAHQDWRYTMLSQKTGMFYPIINFLSIPMADNRQSAKPGFEEYKRQTRMLLPIPKRATKFS